MWYPDKAAFRVGYVDGLQWNKENIGDYSMATGYNSKATGSYSTAMGFTTNASGYGSTAIGYNSTASGQFSVAFGPSNASGFNALALGANAIASGAQSTAMGPQTKASGLFSTALGLGTIASGQGSIAIGAENFAKSAYETVLGRWNTDYIPADTSFWNPADRVFTIGNGTSTINRSDAMVILKNGWTGIGTSTPQTQLQVNGYTMLGSSAPKIQMKKLTGTTGASQGSTVLIAHGLNSAKLLSIEVLVDYGGSSFVHHSYTESAGYQFNFYINPTNIGVVNVVGNSGNILSKQFRVLVTYEE